MYCKLAEGLLIASLVLGACVGYMSARRNETGGPLRNDAAYLRATLVSPVAPSGSVQAEPFELVDMCWTIWNAGDAPVSGLKAHDSCPCRVKTGLPTTVQPGDHAQLCVQVRAPQAGTVERRIHVFAGEGDRPVLELVVPLTVRITTPSWFAAPRDVLMRAVAGDPYHHEVTFEAIERSAEAAWIQSIEAEPSNAVGFSFRVEQKPHGEDLAFCLRRYHLSFRLESGDANRAPAELRSIQWLTNLMCLPSAGPSMWLRHWPSFRQD